MVDGLPELASVLDASVDVALARSVLIYIDGAAKPDAFAATFRVLRPGGRLSMFEPARPRLRLLQPCRNVG